MTSSLSTNSSVRNRLIPKSRALTNISALHTSQTNISTKVTSRISDGLFPKSKYHTQDVPTLPDGRVISVSELIPTPACPAFNRYLSRCDSEFGRMMCVRQRPNGTQCTTASPWAILSVPTSLPQINGASSQQPNTAGTVVWVSDSPEIYLKVS